MKHALKVAATSFACLFAPAWSDATAPAPTPPSDPELATTVESQVEEAQDFDRSEGELAVDRSMSYTCGLFGKGGDDRYPLNGKQIARLEFNHKTSGPIGHGEAVIVKQDSEAVVVHWWCDAFTTVSYDLKVFVKS